MTFEYDLSHSRGSTPPPSPPAFKHKHALPHVSSKHSPSRAYDISCILDPAYASASSSSQSSSSPSSAYVDRHGDLHDPDYRPFAPYAPAHPASNRKRRSAPGGGINIDHHWDTASDGEDADSDDDGNGSETERLHRHHRLATYPHPHHYPSHQQHDRSRSQSGSRTRHASPRRYVPYYEPPFTATTVLSSSPEEEDVTTSHWLGHYNNDVRIRSPDEDEDPFMDFGFDEEEGERKGRRLLKTRRMTRKGEKRKSKDEKSEVEKRVATPIAPSPFQLDEPITGIEDLVPTQQEWTPTCTQSIRRQWQAFSLSLRFSIFRARRRLRRKLLNK